MRSRSRAFAHSLPPLVAFKQIGVEHAGVDDHARCVFPALPAMRIERPPMAIAVKVRLAVHAIRDAGLAVAPADVALAHVLPFLGDLLGKQAGIGGATAARRGRRPNHLRRFLLAHVTMVADPILRREPPAEAPSGGQRRAECKRKALANCCSKG